jgi:two-component system, cell cycle sensor histidine kinase and response regulator CckA
VRVLLVEDDPRVKSLGELVLRHAGYTVITAPGPVEALEAVRTHTDIGVIVTDVVMPHMNGFDLADEVRLLAPGIRVVYMSGCTHDHFKMSVDVPFVAKPFTPQSLADGVQRALLSAN